jgi:hypothetical protein
MKTNIYYLTESENDSEINMFIPIQRSGFYDKEWIPNIAINLNEITVSIEDVPRSDLVLSETVFSEVEIFSVAISDMSGKIIYANDKKRFSDRAYQSYITEEAYLKTLKDSFIIASYEDGIMNIIVKKKCTISVSDDSDATLIPINILHDAFQNSRQFLATKSTAIEELINKNKKYLSIYGEISLDKSISSLEKQVDFLTQTIVSILEDRKDEVNTSYLKEYANFNSLTEDALYKSLEYKKQIRKAINESK